MNETRKKGRERGKKRSVKDAPCGVCGLGRQGVLRRRVSECTKFCSRVKGRSAVRIPGGGPWWLWCGEWQTPTAQMLIKPQIHQHG